MIILSHKPQNPPPVPGVGRNGVPMGNGSAFRTPGVRIAMMDALFFCTIRVLQRETEHSPVRVHASSCRDLQLIITVGAVRVCCVSGMCVGMGGTER